ncbi:YciI family protein [Marinicella litoralis]|uniref:YCII-related domain-containing protein n=1 Tax=Marinicella litoralis TaxID=644220 RepID=A0A4R6XGD2_9GAMM|nr:YciI family protein [Marinicella litoralis]TDR18456.1 YCII-related domain-containing protein [Marinicella litoralis]
MTNYLFIYHGGQHPENPEDMESVFKAWNTWLEGLGDSVVDAGNPVGQSTTVNSDGSVDNHGGSNPAAGYGIFKADSLATAIEMAKQCPILVSGGQVELADIFEV